MHARVYCSLFLPRQLVILFCGRPRVEFRKGWRHGGLGLGARALFQPRSLSTGRASSFHLHYGYD